MQSKMSISSAAIVLVVATSQSSQAALFDLDPGPYLPGNASFAAWYQDTHGRALELCLSKALSSRVPSVPGDVPSYMCSLLPSPGVYDDTQPLVFPSNFPDEAFWFTGDAAIVDANTGVDLLYVSALEAAFSGGLPAEGEQISFARIRIRVDLPTPGTYTVTHPYGVEVFDVSADDIGDDGVRAINMTRDIGIGAPKTYSGALAGDIGPFLRSVNGPYSETNPETAQVESFVGDPNLEEAVTGSPFGTNYLRIEGPNGIDLRTDLFAVSGKLSSVVLPTPVLVERATYSRSTDASGATAQQDVFVQAPPPPGTARFVDTASATVDMTEANATGNWYGQSASEPTPLANVSISADNSAAIASSAATTLAAPLVDLVMIRRAEYSLASGDLTIEASSSDETAPPTLSASASNGSTIGTLSGAGALKILTTRITPIPPARVSVTSANGGSDSEDLVILP